MTRHRSTIAIIAIAGLLLVGAACSTGDDKSSPADSTSVTTADSGSVTTGDSKSSTTSVTLPDGVPAGIAMPEGIKLGPWKESTRNGHRVLTIVGTISDAEGQGADVFEWITGSLIDMGYSLENETGSKPSAKYTATVSGSKDDHAVTVTVTELGPDIRVDYEVVPEA